VSVDAVLVMDGLRRGGGDIIILLHTRSSCSFGSIVRETFFLAEVSILLYVFPFQFYLVDCYMMLCTSYASFS
jgi:hypothetical protein